MSDKLEMLKGLVNEQLLIATDTQTIVAVLQKIETELLRSTITVANVDIQPLWVEAYYFNEKAFIDCNAHLSDKQKSRFGSLYFHETGRGGMDICLSNSNDYYLSFLIKACLINGGFSKQTDVYVLEDKTRLGTDDLERRQVKIADTSLTDAQIVFTPRVGLVKPCYKEERLAAFVASESTLDDLMIYTRQIGRAKTWCNFMRMLLEHRADYTDITISEADVIGRTNNYYKWLAQDDWDQSQKILK